MPDFWSGCKVATPFSNVHFEFLGEVGSNSKNSGIPLIVYS